ncbi:MAG: transglycosylase family protein [bacterium]
MLVRSKLIATLAVAGIGAVPAQAAGAAGVDAGGPEAKLELLDKPEQRLARSIEVHQDRLERRRERRQARVPEFAPPEQYGVSRATLESVAGCESGGDPAAVSSDGTYRGKYQFDTGTWAAVGGSGDPASAPEAEQDMRAAILYSRSGSSPWPVCG